MALKLEARGARKRGARGFQRGFGWMDGRIDTVLQSMPLNEFPRIKRVEEISPKSRYEGRSSSRRLSLVDIGPQFSSVVEIRLNAKM